MLLKADGEVRLIYAGDRMWPSVADGATFAVAPLVEEKLQRGTVVVACPEGVPELMRLAFDRGDRVALRADADPGAIVELSREMLLAAARLPCRRNGRFRALARRLWLDACEAWNGRTDDRRHPAETVRHKYESQSSFYARTENPDMEPGLREWVSGRPPSGSSILVIGSGTGRECFALAEEGFDVVGVDFSPAMVGLARQDAERRGLVVGFRVADIRECDFPPGSLGGVYFSYEVYSFLPTSAGRVDLLRRIRSWLAPGGVVYLSARRLRSLYERAVLTLQWLALSRRGRIEWGESHTRWISADGGLHRSFVRVFSHPQLREEIDAGGFRLESWRGAHGLLVPLGPAIIPR